LICLFNWSPGNPPLRALILFITSETAFSASETCFLSSCADKLSIRTDKAPAPPCTLDPAFLVPEDELDLGDL
jgi:hypothetical protein